MKLIWDLDKIENSLGVCFTRNLVSLGLDTASKTGYCISRTDEHKLSLEVGFIDIDVSKIKDKIERNTVRYDAIYKHLRDIIKSEYLVVIEDVFYSCNPQTLILLARIGAIAYIICKIKKVKNIIWKTAVQARKSLGLPCNKKKVIVQQNFCEKTGITLTNEDEIDAIILALNGLLDHE